MINLIFKTFWDKRLFIFGWALGIAFLSYLMTIFYPTFNEGAIDELANSLPPALQGLVGNLANLKEIDTYIGSQLFEIRLPIFISIFAILLSVGLTVAEEDKGQLRTLISLPISRRSIIFAKWLSLVGICAIAALATIAGIYLGLWQISETIEAMVIVRLVLMSGLLITALATIIFGIGLATGSRAVTTTVGIVVAVGSFILTTFAQSVDWLKDYEWLSILHYFPAPEIAQGTFEISTVFVYVGLIVAALVMALIFFPRRDIKS